VTTVPIGLERAPAREAVRQRTRLGRGPRLLAAIAALLLVVVYVAPLWNIRLIAPQYPEGLGMHIRVNTVTGVKPMDIDNINGLNHYIGMKTIHPDTIPELRYMPWVVAALIAGGLITALVARRRVLVLWGLVYTAVAVAGLVDFWKWEYDYGHNLDMTQAIIKIPGMSYQPPLIGSKQLLNFTASAWPGLGGWAAGLSLGLVAVAIVLAFRRHRETGLG
jgi:copper chaperone NosL